MANHPSADKRNRQSLKRRDRNRARKSQLRAALKKTRAAAEEGNQEQFDALLPNTIRLIDRTVSRGVIHRNAGARYKSRLSIAANRLSS